MARSYAQRAQRRSPRQRRDGRRHEPPTEVHVLIEWLGGEDAPTKYWPSNPRSELALAERVSRTELRWCIEQAPGRGAKIERPVLKTNHSDGEPEADPQALRSVLRRYDRRRRVAAPAERLPPISAAGSRRGAVERRPA